MVKQKTVLIIGCGYFSSQLLERLSGSKKINVLATTTTQTRTNALMEQGAGEVLVWDGTEGAGPFIEKADEVVVSIRSPVHDNERILGALKQLVPVLKPSQHLIYVSSVEVYPGNLAEAREDDGSPEKIHYMMEDAFSGHSLKCIPRIAQLCGPGQDHRGFSRNMKGHLEKIIALTNGVLPGDGKQPVHLTHVQDLVAFVEYAIEKDLRGTFNLCRTLGCDRKKFYEILCDNYQTKAIEWSQNMAGVRHMIVPKLINTENLNRLAFSLKESHYEMDFLLNE